MNNMVIIDAKNLILGRMASEVAKRALLGESIDIINCEQLVITGNRKRIIEKYAQGRARGTPTRGPYITRRPDMFVKRAIRNMLPYKKERGRTAFSRIKCHRGVPKHFEGKELESIQHAHIDKLPNLRFTRVGELCKILGAK